MFKGEINLPTIKVLSGPLLFILIIGILFVYSVKYFSPKIPESLEGIGEVQKTVQNLNTRIEILKSFDSDVANLKSDVTYIVLPDSNPTAIVLSQIKKKLSEYGIEGLDSIDFSGDASPNEAVRTVDLRVEFSSTSLSDVIKTIASLHTIAPLVTVKDVKITSSSGNVKAEVTSSVYWAPLPKTLPDITTPISTLTSEERMTLDKILTFQLPDFSQSTPTAPSDDRQNPFN